MSLAGDAPITRPIEPPLRGKIVAFPKVSGLHHLETVTIFAPPRA